MVGAQAVYDYQPGDVFQRITRSYGASGSSVCQQTWRRDSVLTRQASRTGDTLTYTIRTRRRSQRFGQAGAPSGFCNIPSANTIYPAATSTAQVSQSQLLTGFFTLISTGPFGQETTAASRSTARFGSRPEYAVELKLACTRFPSPDSVAVVNDIDNYSITKYAAGLGLMCSYDSGIYDSNETQLTAFRKGSQTWGTFFGPAVLLAAREVRAAATTAVFPKPFGETLTASFVLASAQPVRATLYDALGRPARAVPPALLGLGSRQLVLPAAGLPAGVYTLQLVFGGDSRREVLSVVKAP